MFAPVDQIQIKISMLQQRFLIGYVIIHAVGKMDAGIFASQAGNNRFIQGFARKTVGNRLQYFRVYHLLIPVQYQLNCHQQMNRLASGI
jgi:hypothetical protein